MFCKPKPKPKPPPKPKWQTAAIPKQRLRDVGNTTDPSDKKKLLSYAGRSIDKRKGEGPFPKPKGNQKQRNAQGQKALDRILDDPASNTHRYVHDRSDYGTILQVDGPPSVGGGASSSTPTAT